MISFLEKTVEEVFATLDCCLAMTETAFEKSGDVNAMPGTCEYGSRRTGALATGTSKKKMIKSNER